MVDTRGFGRSTGCPDFGEPGEQADVKAASNWSAKQSWSHRRSGHERQVVRRVQTSSSFVPPAVAGWRQALPGQADQEKRHTGCPALNSWNWTNKSDVFSGRMRPATACSGRRSCGCAR
ncbi:CocE/NonD family hydrolase [Streptomyces sp. NPDC050988]|uniref:CocE/NonD family hydrolase n=1 Tax=Streptomyces sp. NPDC050988 TaxID=3365637 RepID=UPI0037A1262B